MTIETGALEQSYIKKETAYNVSPRDTLAATDGIRHLSLAIQGKNNREPSPQKRGTPDVQTTMARRKTAGWNLSAAMWEPTGTIGTPSDISKLIKGAMGAQHTIGAGLVTTIASGALATGATLTSVTGLQVGDLVVVTLSSGARREVTRIKTIVGSVVTWDPLSAAPDSPGAVVSGVTYQLANTLADTFAVYKYYNAGGFKQAVYGSVVDQMTVTFDGSTEVMLAFQGPAAQYSDATGTDVQAKPGAFTTVGSAASGLVGNFYVDGNAFLVTSVAVTVDNKTVLRNKELGTQYASGIAGRGDMRPIKVTVGFYLEDTRLIGMANTVTRGVLRCVVGNTNGNMVAMVAPSVEFEIPDVSDTVGPKEMSIEGMAMATIGNDALFLGEL